MIHERLSTQPSAQNTSAAGKESGRRAAEG
jgi:hypothetical protein